MRVAIDFRILAVGPGLINRGMVRFTQQQLRNVVAEDSANEYVLLCRRGDDLSLIDPELWAAPSVSVCHPPGWSAGAPADHTSLLRRSAELQDWLCQQDVDLYHATTPFLFQDPYLMDFDACPMVATLYDMIPLIFPEHYLARDPERSAYSYGLTMVTKATRLLAISESAKRDANLYLGFPKDRIDVVSPVADDSFRPLGDGEIAQLLASLRDRVRLPESFVLTVSHLHHTKNAGVLLEAYARIDPRLRVRFPLVFCCHMGETERAVVQSMADALGIGDDLVVTGQVSDRELAALYNTAAVVVHPSRYEGFGLPVLEAMQCGAPVVTTTSSSLPEVAGSAAALVEPDDADGLARALADVLQDPDRRAAMIADGLRQAAVFSGDRLAQGTLEAYAKALVPSPGPVPRAGRLRIAMWAPLPPEQTGVSDYSVELLAELAKHAHVEVFVDEGFLPDVEILRAYTVHDYRAFERRRAQVGFDVVVYQVGTSFFHWYMHDAMQRYPGVVVLHDLSWSHLLYAYAEIHGEVDRFRHELKELEGTLALRRFDAISDGPPSMREELFDDYPMLGRIVESSPAVIVHFDGARRELEARYPEASVKTVMMGVADPCRGPRQRDVSLARRRLELPDSAFVVGVFGIVHPTKRLEASITALPEVLEADPAAVVLVVGRALDPRYRAELEKLAADLGVASAVRFFGQVDRRTFDAALLGCDVVVNLRSTAVTHLSATLVRALAAAKPVVTSEGRGWEFVPVEARCLVPSGPDEVPALAAELKALATDPERRRRMGEASRSYFEQEATVARMVERYLDVVEEVRARALPAEART